MFGLCLTQLCAMLYLSWDACFPWPAPTHSTLVHVSRDSHGPQCAHIFKTYCHVKCIPIQHDVLTTTCCELIFTFFSRGWLADSVEGIILDVSRHLNESGVAVGTMGSGAGPAGSHSTTGKTVNLLRFATFCLCSLSAWTLGRRALVTCQAAKKLVHILSYSDDSLVLEFAALALSNCATEAEGSAVVVLGAPTLCKMLKSRRFREALSTGHIHFRRTLIAMHFRPHDATQTLCVFHC